MAGYVIVQLDVHDVEAFERYRGQVGPTIEQYGGRYLVRGGRMERLEGDEPLPRCVVLEFPSYEQARAWYDSDEYAAPKALRHSASRANTILVEGV